MEYDCRPREFLPITTTPQNDPCNMIFCVDNKWLMKFSNGRIYFNREDWPEYEPDDFAKSVIDILEKSIFKSLKCKKCSEKL